MNEQNYIIAPKREFRELVPPDWQKRLRQIEGVQIIGAQPTRIQVQASPEAIDEVRQALGQTFHIEESIPHTLKDPSF